MLVSVACDRSALLERRQLCLTIIKEAIRSRWNEVAANDVRFLLSSLLQMVVDGNKSIRSLCHSCLAYATSQLGVKKWPELFETIWKALLSESTPSEGKLSVLSLLSSIIDECGGSAFGDSVHEMTSMLLQVAQDRIVTRKAFSVYCVLLVNLSKDEELSILSEMKLSDWSRVVAILSDSGNVADIISVLKDLKECVSEDICSFPQDVIRNVLLDSVLWVERSRQSFESLVVLSEEGGIDEDEEAGGLCSLLIAICDFITVVSVSEVYYSSVLTGNLLFRFVSSIPTFLQISILTEQEWIQFPGEYIANEQDEFAAATIRLSFEGLVADLLWHPHLGVVMRDSLLDSAKASIQKGLEGRNSGNNEWWRHVEVGLFIFGLLSGEAHELKKINAVEILRQCAQLCIVSEKPIHVLLQSRAFLVLAHMHLLTCEEFRNDIESILNISVSCMWSKSPVLTFAACKAFTAFVPQLNDHLKDLVTGPKGAFQALLNLCADHASDEVVHFSLDALITLCSAGGSVIKVSGNLWNTFLINLLRQKVDDPIAPDQIQKLVRLTAQDQQSFDSLVPLVAVEVRPWLRPKAENRLDVALELLAVLVEHASVPFSPQLVDCILIVNQGHLGKVGPITSDLVDSILRTCAVRSSA